MRQDVVLQGQRVADRLLEKADLPRLHSRMRKGLQVAEVKVALAAVGC